MSAFDTLASKATLEKTIAALKANGFEPLLVKTKAEALEAVRTFVPSGAEVFTMTSITLDQSGIAEALNGPAYDSVRNRLGAMDGAKEARAMRKLGAGPDIAVGSVHAVTEGGALVIASNTGSQLPAYAYGAGTLVFVVGTQKIVRDLDAAFARIDTHVVPKESVRARKAYGLPESFNTFPSKVLVYNREVQPGRVKVILVEEALGF